jgi:hypothetical protein
LSTALGLSNFVTLDAAQTITGQKQFTVFPILSSVEYTGSHGNEVKLYSSHNVDSRWIFNSVGVHNKIFSFRVNDLQRWAFRVNNNAESGSNAGTNFELRRYNDGGAFIDSPISVSRQTGQVDFGGDIQLLASMKLGDGVTLSNGELQALDGIATTATIQDQLNTKGFIYYMSTGPASVTLGAGIEQTLATITIPAGILEVGSRVEFYYNFVFVGTNAAKSVRVKNGATNLNNVANTASSALGVTGMNLYRVTSSTQMIGSTGFFGQSQAAATQVTSTINIATDTNITFSAVRSSASDTITLIDCYIKVLK